MTKAYFGERWLGSKFSYRYHCTLARPRQLKGMKCATHEDHLTAEALTGGAIDSCFHATFAVGLCCWYVLPKAFVITAYLVTAFLASLPILLSQSRALAPNGNPSPREPAAEAVWTVLAPEMKLGHLPPIGGLPVERVRGFRFLRIQSLSTVMRATDPSHRARLPSQWCL